MYFVIIIIILTNSSWPFISKINDFIIFHTGPLYKLERNNTKFPEYNIIIMLLPSLVSLLLFVFIYFA